MKTRIRARIAAQHGMVWVNPGEIDCAARGTIDETNHLGSYLGVMGQTSRTLHHVLLRMTIHICSATPEVLRGCRPLKTSLTRRCPYSAFSSWSALNQILGVGTCPNLTSI